MIHVHGIVNQDIIITLEQCVLYVLLDHIKQELVCYPVLNAYYVMLELIRLDMDPPYPPCVKHVSLVGINQEQDPINALYALQEHIRQVMVSYL